MSKTSAIRIPIPRENFSARAQKEFWNSPGGRDALVIRILKRLNALSSSEGLKLLDELDKKITLPGRMIVYPDISIITRTSDEFHFSFSPQKDEFSLVSVSDYTKVHVIPVDLGTYFEFGFRKPLVLVKEGKRTEVEEKVTLQGYIGEGQLLVQDQNKAWELLDTSSTTLEGSSENISPSAFKEFRGSDLSVVGYTNNYIVFKGGWILSVYTRVPLESVADFRNAQASAILKGFSGTSFTDLLLYVNVGRYFGVYNIFERRNAMDPIELPISEIFRLVPLSDTKFAVVDLTYKSTSVRELYLYTLSAGAKHSLELGVREIQVIDDVCTRRLGDDAFLTASGKMYREGTLNRGHGLDLEREAEGTTYEKVDSLPEGIVSLTYPSHSRLREIAQSLVPGTSTNVDLIAIVVGFCCEWIAA